MCNLPNQGTKSLYAPPCDIGFGSAVFNISFTVLGWYTIMQGLEKKLDDNQL